MAVKNEQETGKTNQPEETEKTAIIYDIADPAESASTSAESLEKTITSQVDGTTPLGRLILELQLLRGLAD